MKEEGPSISVKFANSDASPEKYNYKATPTRSLNALHGGKLNPEWIEWLMGWPSIWTDLERAEMESFHSKQESHIPSLSKGPSRTWFELINRVWEIPNKHTFKIPSISKFLAKIVYPIGDKIILDPFANRNHGCYPLQ